PSRSDSIEQLDDWPTNPSSRHLVCESFLYLAPLTLVAIPIETYGSEVGPMVARPDAARTDRLPLDNATAARRLEQAARILEAQDANIYRVRAYRTAAQTVRTLDEPAAELLSTGGRAALQQLPGIGDRLAVTLEQLLLTGHIPHVEGLGARPED